MSDSVQPHRQQPTRLPRLWDPPGKNTGVGCHFLLQCMKVKSESEVAQSCPPLSNPMDCSLPGSSIHGIFQARVLEWVTIAFSSRARSHLILSLANFYGLTSFFLASPFADIYISTRRLIAGPTLAKRKQGSQRPAPTSCFPCPGPLFSLFFGSQGPVKMGLPPLLRPAPGVRKALAHSSRSQSFGESEPRPRPGR